MISAPTLFQKIPFWQFIYCTHLPCLQYTTVQTVRKAGATSIDENVKRCRTIIGCDQVCNRDGLQLLHLAVFCLDPVKIVDPIGFEEIDQENDTA